MEQEEEEITVHVTPIKQEEEEEEQEMCVDEDGWALESFYVPVEVSHLNLLSLPLFFDPDLRVMIVKNNFLVLVVIFSSLSCVN